MTQDEQITHALADRQIELFRLDAGISDDAQKKIEALAIAVLAAIRAYGKQSLSNKQAGDLRAEITRLVGAAYKDIATASAGSLSGFAQHEADVTAALLVAAGVGFDTVNVGNTAPSLVGVPMDTHWQNAATATAMTINEAVGRGVVNGKSANDIADDEALSLAARATAAATLVKTAVQSEASRARMAVYGAGDATRGYIHTSVLDGRTSLVCRVRSGAIWDLDYKPIMGTSVEFDMPPLHRRCRSFIRPWFGGDVNDVSSEDWLAAKSTEQQDAMLGVGRADLWRRNVITFNDLLDQSGRPLTLKELKELRT